MHDKIFISADFEQKIFAKKSAKNRKHHPKLFCSKSAKMKILSSKVSMGIKLYETNFFDLCSEKIEHMFVVNAPQKKRFCDLCKVEIRNTLYEIKFYELCGKKGSL